MSVITSQILSYPEMTWKSSITKIHCRFYEVSFNYIQSVTSNTLSSQHCIYYLKMLLYVCCDILQFFNKIPLKMPIYQ